jgi:formylglycine-generating enzyme required for sulfatase activity
MLFASAAASWRALTFMTAVLVASCARQLTAFEQRSIAFRDCGRCPKMSARSGSTTARPWGEQLTPGDANYGSDPCCGAFASGQDKWLYTSPVGSFPANRFGLYDMIGNIWQWTADCGNDTYAGAPNDASAWTTGDCSTRIIRGGAWFQGPESSRSASRAADGKNLRRGDIGFRVALSI